jgi:hypothetical protein
MLDAKEFSARYYAWLRDNTFSETIRPGISRLSYPFLDTHNDFTEIYVIEAENGSYRLTDDGQTISDVICSGLPMTKRRQEMIDEIIRTFGVSREDNEIYVEATLLSMPVRKHRLLCALSRVQDMLMSTKENVKIMFFDDVAAFLDENKIRYSSKVGWTGKSQLSFNVEFLIPKSEIAPERAIRIFNSFNDEKAKALVFGWEDIRDVRNPKSLLYTFLRETEDVIDSSALTCIREYDIKPVFWESRHLIIDELAA